MAPQPSPILFAGTTVYFTNTMPPLVFIIGHSSLNPSLLYPDLSGKHLERVNVDSGWFMEALFLAQETRQPHRREGWALLETRAR